MNILENYSLINKNTFHVSATAKYFAETATTEEIENIVDFALNRNEKILILGGGSNILFTKNFDGVIIKPANMGIEILEENSEYSLIEIGSGQAWDSVVSFSTDKDLYGIENLVAIPGNSGAAPIQNIGAYGVELKDVFDSLYGYDIVENKWKILSNSDCKFSYRYSVFKDVFKGRFIIYSIRLKLFKEKKVNLHYSNLREYFQDNIESINSKKVAEVIRSIRDSKLPSTDIYGNAGSFFKNPLITNDLYEDLKAEYESMPLFKVDDLNYKIPAAWLIEQCGFKGLKKGNVGCYKNQSLVIINYGNASGNEILDFAMQIRHAVKNKFYIELEFEVNIE